MEKIEFTRNDNHKLFLEFFGCIRFHDADKFKLGNRLEITLKGQSMGTVEVIAVRKFQYKHLSDVLAFLDCGKPLQFLAAGIKKMDPNVNAETDFDHVVLQWLTRNMELQAALMVEWFKEVDELHRRLSPDKSEANG